MEKIIDRFFLMLISSVFKRQGSNYKPILSALSCACKVRLSFIHLACLGLKLQLVFRVKKKHFSAMQVIDKDMKKALTFVNQFHCYGFTKIAELISIPFSIE